MKFTVIDDQRLQKLEANILFIKAFLEAFHNKLQQERWLTKTEAQQRLKCSKKTIENHMRRGILPYSQVNAKIYFKAEDIEQFLLDGYNSRA